jgi:predicted ATPase
VSFNLQINNYRVLKSVDLNVDGVCLIVGPNGCGKTTLLSAIELLRNTFERGFGSALNFLGGPAGFTHFLSPTETSTTFAIETGGFRWELNPIVYQNGVVHPIPEKLTRGNSVLFSVESGESQFQYQQQAFLTSERVPALRRVYENCQPRCEFENLIQPLIQYQRCYNYHHWQLIKSGSSNGSENVLNFGGQNAFSVLRNWFSSKPLRERYEFVISVLQEAFPNFFEDIDFDSAGNTVFIRVYHKKFKDPIPIHLLSNGFIIALLHLMAICSVPDGGIMSIDEPENGLHPYAIRKLIEAFRERAEEHNLTVLLATHSSFMLNEFMEEPNRVYVMDQDKIIPLDKLRDPEWLKYFALGDLYGKEFALQGD